MAVLAYILDQNRILPEGTTRLTWHPLEGYSCA
jgi:hypothetical protein